MAPSPKKRKIGGNWQDIRTFYGQKNMSQVRVKEDEEAGTSVGGHSHSINVKFDSDKHKYTMHCNKPRTLLEAIKSQLAERFENFNKTKCDTRIIIKRGEADDSPLVATHFPCSCLDDGELLTLSTSTNDVEVPNQNQYNVQEKDKYSIFFIDKEGGQGSKSKVKQIFRCTDIAQTFKYFCVYGLKDMTAEEALKQDGRFVDNLGVFTLSNNEKDSIIKCTEKVIGLQGKYKICLPKQRQTKGKDAKQQKSNRQVKQESNDSQRRSEIRVLELACEKGISLKTANEDKGSKISLNDIQDLLRQQFPELKELMKKRFPGQAFKEALNLQKENFGKIQDAFSEVYRIRELCDLSKSVCLVMVDDKTSSRSIQSTGFVLFDNFILTNAHLFDPWSKDRIKSWCKYIKITAEFNFENPKTESRKKIEAKLFDGSRDLDFAVLKLIPENLNTGQATETEKDIIPPGLLRKFGPLPQDGHACLFGHPAGGIKKMDLTCVIKKEDREDHIFTICAVKHKIKKDPMADICVTYNTFMYHGSSGSPVFDAYGQVFGMHSGGFLFGFPKANESVIEFAFPLLAIFERFVRFLKERGNEKLLSRVQSEAEGNTFLKEIMDSVVGPREDGHEGQTN